MAHESIGHGCGLPQHHDHRRGGAQIGAGIIGARNIVMHAYEYLKPELIREMAEKSVPDLLDWCLRLLQESTSPERS